MYSTCSLEAEENEAVIAAFLKKRADFKQETARAITPMDGVCLIVGWGLLAVGALRAS